MFWPLKITRDRCESRGLGLLGVHPAPQILAGRHGDRVVKSEGEHGDDIFELLAPNHFCLMTICCALVW